MDIQQIKNFLKLSEELHFWRTAGIINITQSALSRQIQQLENELGLQLFERNNRNVKLTAAGAFLKDKWSVLLNDMNHVNQFAKKIAQGESGHIRIAHPDSISYSLLPELLSNLSVSYPALTIELVQLLYENIQESLLSFKIDIAFTRQVNNLPGISSKKIKSEPVALFVPHNHSFKTVADVTAENFADQRFILPVEERKSRFYFLVKEILDHYGFTPDAIYQSDFGSSMLGLVRAGLGIAFLPLDFMHHQVEGVRAIELPFTTDIYISWRTHDNNPALKNVVALIENYISS